MTTADPAYKYWVLLRLLDRIERYDAIGILGIERCLATIENSIRELGLTESAEKMLDKKHRIALETVYGRNEDTTPVEHLKMRLKVRTDARIDPQFVDLLKITKQTNTEMSSSYAIQHWLRGRGTVEFLTLW